MPSNLHQLTTKIVSLSRSGFITTARKLFDEMPHKDSITWNAMLSSYSQLSLHKDSLSLFHLMRSANAKPDHFTFTSTLNACSGFASFRNGTKTHALIIVFGYQSYLPVNNSLIDMYGKCLDPGSARKVFQEMDQSLRNEVTWCSLLFAYVNSAQFDIALKTFNGMPEKVLVAWNIMISGFARSLMNVCTESLEYAYGRAVHGFIIRTGWCSAVEVKNSILSFYAKLGCMDVAVTEFESVGLLNQVSWNAMIDGYIKMGNTFEAFNVFQRMPEKNVISWTSMIAGYARNGEGEQAQVVCSDGSSYAFDEILDKDLVSWNAMLFGFGMHGLSTQALQVYDDMVAHGMRPDKVSFIGLLMICSHAGLVNKGRLFFDLMGTVYGLTYEIDHVACMVDMLGRGGYLVEAKELASKYLENDTVEAKSCSYEALLGACSIHGDVGMGVSVGYEFQNSIDCKKDMSYVLLSNLYCASGQWKEAEIVRRAMVDQGIKKMPGYSWIEVKNKNWNIKPKSDNGAHQKYKFEFVEMLAGDAEDCGYTCSKVPFELLPASLPEEIVFSNDLKRDVDRRQLNGPCSSASEIMKPPVKGLYRTPRPASTSKSFEIPESGFYNFDADISHKKAYSFPSEYILATEDLELWVPKLKAEPTGRKDEYANLPGIGGS
ncbi:Bifunctional 3-dehydroquinate dehydratase/shikimate dehydrogenase isoform 1 [Hibiscus syriacus]|uniref:Bifunctional 3-dehydroquinate dehydratase/shikimate dehydrogenase isoform 1 n=1 Tax=Hibiscus syriacus TaxID=106335 RepID=A0A6A2ZEN2_HIBSY|nr:Bifunctional 3-dehydroquinate dehydratase/shikimate dehydrogenase isoform 1 [Hibiscus syriacus]